MTTKTTTEKKPISRNRLLGIAGLGWLFDALDVGILVLLYMLGY
ncbi:Putative niacin/nicotinamide transporter NaiP [Kurthia zopfii]|nr:Putative niacin/nicotinamide transporter NaiP [Kurthia zopfii]